MAEERVTPDDDEVAVEVDVAMEPAPPEELTGVEKAAVLLLALGPETAGAVLRHLTTDEQVRVGKAMASMPTQPRRVAASLLEELGEQANGGSPIYSDQAQIRQMFSTALGNEQASHLIEHFMPNVGAASLRNFKWIAPQDAADLIKSEHPQIIATIFAHLEASHAAKIVHHLPGTLRGDVILRLATLDRVRPTALQELDEALTRVLADTRATTKLTGKGGIRAAADIVSNVDHQDEAAILARVRQFDPAVADRLVLLFDHLGDIDDRGLQLLIRHIESDNLIVALKGAPPSVQDRFFVNMSSDAAEMLKEELDLRGAVRLSDVEVAQRKIVAIARKLAEEGRLSLPVAGGGDYE